MEQEIIEMSPIGQVHDVRISVSSELSEHYNKILKRRDDILDNPDSEDRTVVSILTATTAIIKELVKIQESLYNSEKFAVLQQVIVDVLKETDPEFQEKVMEEFESRVAAL